MKKKKKAKKPKVVVPPGGWPNSKIPVVPPIPSRTKKVLFTSTTQSLTNDERLSWRFSDIDVQWQHLENTLDNKKLLSVIQKLKEFESMTLGEIFRPGDHFKRYTLDKIPAHSYDRLCELKRDDEDEIVRLRFSGKNRLYGIMRGNIFNVLWWDPHHKVWPSIKKNT